MSSHFSFMFKQRLLKFLKNIIIILFLGITNFSHSQIYEIGYITGKSNFIGDIGETKFVNPLYNNISKDWISGISFKWNRSPRHSYRLTYIYTDLAANDLNSNDPRRIERGYFFRTPLSEFSIGMDFNFIDFDLHQPYNIITPYISTGIIHSKFKEQKLIEGIITRQDFSEITIGIPIILGIKYRFLNNFILSVETGARYTFTDKIDGNNYTDEIINYNFGNTNNNDWYMFTIMNISYTFGRNPCYCNIGK